MAYKGVTYNKLVPTRPLGNKIDKLRLLRQSQVDFIPLGNGQTLRTRPLLESSSIGWRERFVDAAIIYITNPLCFSAQSVINDELVDARFFLEEKQGYKWKEVEGTPLDVWIRHPNKSMDIKEYIRAYSTHLHTFGAVYSYMFQKGDILPNGKINTEKNCFDIIFPGRVGEDAVSDAYGINWYYQPIGWDEKEPLPLNQKSLFMDVLYNPVAHSLGVALPTNPLDKIFKIHRLYLNQIERFFTDGAMPSHVLTRVIDIQKEANSMSLSDDDIEQAVQRVYRTVGRGGVRDGGWLGLRGDWRVNKVGTELPDLLNKDLLQMIDVAVGAVYKVPPSLYWAGMEAGGGRATRQQDSIDFYNMKIKPLRERILNRLSDFLVPLFIKGETSKKYRISADVSESGLAQYSTTKMYRMYERWYQLRAIPRGIFLEWINEAEYAADLDPECYNEYYSGSNNSQGMNIGAANGDNAGDNSIEGGSGGSGSSGDKQPV